MSFYLKYRPSKIEELDLENIRSSMFALSKRLGDIPHAFLFAGPRGAGKTSSARILAKLVNCENLIANGEYFEPCNNCSSCKLIDAGSSMDVIEVDAASNRGIDDIRSLRENVNLSPTTSKYKFYIMDEAHMLTTEAANAFLKTLEEPPKHVIFVLATTDPQKLPETIHSRLTTLNFRKATPDEIKRQLSRVATAENITLSDEVMDIVISKSDGSFRDAVKILEVLVTELDSLTLENVQNLLEETSKIDYETFVTSVLQKDFSGSLSIFDKYDKDGGDTKVMIEKLTETFREAMLFGNQLNLNRREAVAAIKLLLVARENVRRAHIPRLAVEIFLSEWCTSPEIKNTDANAPDNSDSEGKEVKKKSVSTERKKLDELSWAKILSGVREKNASIEALLRAAKPKGVAGDVMDIGVYYRFHKERLETTDLKIALESVVEEVLGAPTKVRCILEERKEPAPEEKSLTATGEGDIISAAKEIFG